MLEGEQLAKKWHHRFGQATGHLKKVDQEVRVIKDGKRYLVINDVSINPVQIKRQYG